MGRLIVLFVIALVVVLGIWALLPFFQERKPISGTMPKHRREALTVDELLEKISTSGVDSLTPEERDLLASVSEKYKSRAESKKPDSDLII